PPEVVRAKIDPRTGRRLPDSGLTARMSRLDVFLKDALPAAAQPSDYEPETGRAYLSDDYAPWIARGDHWLTGLVCVRSGVDHEEPPRVLTPVDGSILFLDPDLPDGGRRLSLRAHDAAAVTW